MIERNADDMRIVLSPEKILTTFSDIPSRYTVELWVEALQTYRVMNHNPR